ncbi:MAG: chemotaxis protein CheW [Lachnospiraceae bacterium]|nr:chemotaxis protein CheW [Lachnospiraceae bacterium]
MKEILDSFLSFCVGEISYIVSVTEVERIALLDEVSKEEDIIWIDLGLEENRIEDKRSCAVLLQEENGRFGIVVSEVEGVVQMKPEEQFEIPDVLQPMYPWMLGAAVSQGKLFLLLNGQQLASLTDGEKMDGKQ